MSDETTHHKQITIDGNTVQFDTPIFDQVELNDMVVVLLEWTDEEFPDRTRNVYAVARDGSILWQIDRTPDNIGGNHSAYGGLHVIDDDLWATSVAGVSYKLDVRSGEIVDTKIVK